LQTYQTEKEVGMELNVGGVSVQNLTKLYPRKGRAKSTNPSDYIAANDNISLEIQPGEIFGLLGPNGAGKTTLVNQLLGLTRPDSGTILVEGLDVTRYPQQVKEITAYLPQQGMAFGSIEVWRALSFTGQLRGLKTTEANTQAKSLIAELDLEQVANRYLNQLSGGMKRMVGFAMALMGQPKLLVLDEPTNELDPARRRLVWETIRNINRQRSITCLLVTHNVLEADSVLERLAVLASGKVRALGTPGQLKQEFSQEARLDLALANPLPKPLPEYFSETHLAGLVRVEPEPYLPLRFRLYFPPHLANEVLGVLIHRLGMSYLDDFKLALPSLEDVYLHLVNSEGVNND